MSNFVRASKNIPPHTATEPDPKATAGARCLSPHSRVVQIRFSESFNVYLDLSVNKQLRHSVVTESVKMSSGSKINLMQPSSNGRETNSDSNDCTKPGCRKSDFVYQKWLENGSVIWL